MAGPEFRSFRSNFHRVNSALVDMVTGHMAQDIEVELKVMAGMPVDKGQMKAATRAFRNSTGKQRVEINKSYAATQEKGGYSKGGKQVTFKHYTTPGTSSGFFRRAIDKVWKNRMSYINEARRALNL